MLDPPNVLDHVQFNRIEAVHRGFLYQHLYAVACFFRAEKTKISSIVVEADEDVELAISDRRLYIQIKTRAETLTRTDIESALERFTRLRGEHSSGVRAGASQFAIVSNVPPGKTLLGELAAKEWPSDVEIYWPGNPPSTLPMPRPWNGVGDAIATCKEEAAKLPFGMLLPETLVLKLAGLVMAAAAGISPRADHTFRTDELPTLFEQLAVQLQELPAPPLKYRHQTNEPPLDNDANIRMIVGFSGAGKTAWVAQAAIHAATDVAYFDVGDTPSTAITTPLARELAAHFFGNSGGLGRILMPGATGFEMLSAMDRRFASEGMRPIVIVDNAHRVAAEDLGAIFDRMPNIRFTLLCQPGETVQRLEALRALTPEVLTGWTTDTIAEEAADEGCVVSADSARKTLDLTAGLPLYVQNAVRIAKKEYGGNLAECCRDIERLAHSVTTAQELILSRTFDALSLAARDVAAVLSLSDIPLERVEAQTLCKKVMEADDASFATALKELRPTGAIEIFGSDRIKVHDAMRLLGRDRFATFVADKKNAARNALRDILLQSILRKRDLQRLSLYLRLLGEMGDLRSLVQFATDELFHEFGVLGEIRDVLERGAAVEANDPVQRFAALDALAFDDLRRGDTDSAAEHLRAMQMIAKVNKLDDTDRANFENKTMLLAAQLGDGKTVDEQIAKLRKLYATDAMRDRIVRYNVAHAVFKLGRLDECIAETTRLIPEYYDLLGITPAQVMGRNPDKLFELIDKPKDHTDNIKHLADALDLQSQALNKAGRMSAFARIHAMKFYAMIDALQSIVRVGQDLADEFIGRHDYIGAREVLEKNVLPNVIKHKMMEYIVPVRSQYAVVLAYCGDHDAADAEIARLVPYESGLEPEGRAELRAQRLLIADLRKRPPAPQWQMPQQIAPHKFPGLLPRKIGRNEPCFCGSGTKYKKCHGKGV